MTIFRSSALIAALLIAGCNAPQVSNEATPKAPATPAATGVRALDAKAQQALAFKTVFGKAGPVAGEDGFETRADKLIWLGDRAVLITVTEAKEDAGACHACSGSLGLYYLAPEGDGFHVTGKFPEAVPGNGFGGAPSEWSVSDKFGPVPVLYSEAGWTGQGYTCTNFRLTELRADKPVAVANVPIYYDDNGTGAPDAKGEIEGKFGTIVPGKSFTLNFNGFKHFTQTWTRKGDSYARTSGDEMESC